MWCYFVICLTVIVVQLFIISGGGVIIVIIIVIKTLLLMLWLQVSDSCVNENSPFCSSLFNSVAQ